MLTIHNAWTGNGAPQMYLWLEYKSDGSSRVQLDGVAQKPDQYIKMTGASATLTWDTINAGNLSFVTFKDNKLPTDQNGKHVKWAVNDDVSLGGFIEFTQIIDSTTGDRGTIWADLSNVDGVGLLCGLSGLPESEGSKAGYKEDQQSFVSNLLAEFPTLPADARPSVEISGKTYQKVIAPGKSAGDQDPWDAIIGAYYKNIIGKNRNISLTIPNYDNGNWTGKQYANGQKFTGQGFDDIPMAVHITSTFSSDKTDACIHTYTYDIFIAKSKWTADTISKADGSHAVYIRTNNPDLPDFQPVSNPPKDDPNPWGTKWTDPAGKTYGYDSMGINPILSKDSTQPFPIPALAFAISRICAVIQSGYINDTNNNPIVYPDATSGKKYGGNLYNDWILKNSNSYGQPYSDGQAQVLYHPPKSFNLFIFSPDATDTGDYYVKQTTPVKPVANYQLTIGGGAAAAVDKISIGGQTITGDNGAFMIPGSVMNPDEWVPATLHFKDTSTTTWQFKLEKDPNAYKSTPLASETVKPSSNLVWQETGNADVPYNLVSPPLT